MTRTDRWQDAFFLAAAAIALGNAVHIANGFLDPEAITYLSWAFVFCALAVFMPRVKWLEQRRESPTVLLLTAGLIFQFGELLTDPPGMYLLVEGPQAYVTYYKGLIAAAVVAGSLVPNGTWFRNSRILALLAIHFALGLWLIHASPSPVIDVFLFQRDGINELFAGGNPYAMTYLDIYGKSTVYGEGLSVNGRLTFGFPYPPLSLFLAIPGHLFGDHRYSQLAAMTASGALMAYARPGRLGALAGALFLFTPRGLFVLEQSWTEPFLVFLLSATVFAACRRETWVPYLFGLFVVVKQYLVFVVPLAWLILRRPLPDRNELGRWALKAVGNRCGGLVAVGAVGHQGVHQRRGDLAVLPAVPHRRAHLPGERGACRRQPMAHVVGVHRRGARRWLVSASRAANPGWFRRSCRPHILWILLVKQAGLLQLLLLRPGSTLLRGCRLLRRWHENTRADQR